MSPGVAALDQVGDLRGWDLIVVNSSAGKDSQTALRQVWRVARDAGVLDRVVVQYNCLGERVSWPDTLTLARTQAQLYGLRFEVRRRPGGDLLDEIHRRGKFPDAARRWCTSDFKRTPGFGLLTALVRELGLDRPARIVYVYGFRAQESDNRAKKAAFGFNKAASNKTRRHVYDWYPIHHWTVEQVWADIHASRVPYHWAYDEGMTRLSCSFCVLASRADLLRAVRLRPDVAREYAAVEAQIGHQFQESKRMADLIAQAGVAS